ncbi:MAG: rRNA maturation RNase YbeY [Acholeplasmataceae bacterium]|nr:rRNA maturation RNase YbeY [Acholeplasmataceae bacterium]
MKINLHNQTKENITEIKALIKSIFNPIKQSKNMQIIFVDQKYIQQMNQTYRHIDKPTDVLSFINDDQDDDSLGDIFISIEQAKIQASDYGHSIEREIGFLAVHGYLHLLGYDHHTPEEEKLMIEEQERILKNAKLERTTS